ncbi:MAG: hypothetical protein HDQ88_07105 [Clostridia bacterium]|nr:hypothetical protein [Clostridia bacterium]
MKIIDNLYESECMKIEEMQFSKDGERALKEFNKLHEKFLNTLTEEQQDMLDKLFTLDAETFLEREKYAYKLGFKTGVLLSAEVKEISNFSL